MTENNLKTLSFSLRLHKLRKEKKLTQRQLGSMANVAYNTIYNWETGLSVPTKNSKPLVRVADALGVDVSVLLDYDPNQVRRSSDETNRLISEIAQLCFGHSNVKLTKEDASTLLFTTTDILNRYLRDCDNKENV